MTESLTTNLAKIEGLQVISRTSVMRFKGSDAGIPEIHEALGVDYVIEGSLLRSGGRCRVSAQLIRAADDSHVWVEEYEFSWEEIFRVQQQIARNVAFRANAKLLASTNAPEAWPTTSNIEAYDVFMRGRRSLLQYRERGNQEYFDVAEAALNEAIEEDERYADALAELAFLHYSAFRLGRGPGLL